MAAGLAFAGLLWSRHRWGLVAAGVYLVGAAALTALLVPNLTPDYMPSVFGLLVLPAMSLAIALLVVFTFVFDSDVVGRDSAYPTHLLRLPVSTALLAGWPIVTGAVTAIAVWLLFAHFILRPWAAALNGTVPLGWPAVLSLAYLAWTQALLWLPLGLPWLRAFLFIAMIPAFASFTEHSLEAGIAPDAVAGLLAVLTLLGWTVACIGVRRARCGATPNWEAALRPIQVMLAWLPRRRTAFPSAAAAQLWFEWQLAGYSLPLMVAVLLPFVLLPLVFGTNDALPIEQTLLSTAAMVVYVAGLSPWRGDVNRSLRHELSSFIGALPITNFGMAATLLKVTCQSTLAAWGYMLTLTLAAVWFTGNWIEATTWWRTLVAEQGTLKTVLGVAAATLVLMAWTWKRRIDALYLHLTGRRWVNIVVASIAITGALGVCMLAVLAYKLPVWRQTALAMAPWLIAPLLVLRLTVAVYAVRWTVRLGLVDATTIGRWTLGWLMFAVVMIGLLLWAAAGVVPVHYPVLAVLWAIPMAGPAAMPLALAWNRHR